MEHKLTNVTIPVTTKEQLKGLDLDTYAILSDNFNLESLIKNLPMVEMVYGINRIGPKIIAKGNLFGYDFYVLSYGTHPCCYVRIPVGHKFYDVDYDDIPFYCHGGLTFGERDLFDSTDEDYFIGWDYGHAGDFSGFDMSFGFGSNGHKYTTKELVLDCLESIRDFVKELTKE